MPPLCFSTALKRLAPSGNPRQLSLGLSSSSPSPSHPLTSSRFPSAYTSCSSSSPLLRPSTTPALPSPHCPLSISPSFFLLPRPHPYCPRAPRVTSPQGRFPCESSAFPGRQELPFAFPSKSQHQNRVETREGLGRAAAAEEASRQGRSDLSTCAVGARGVDGGVGVGGVGGGVVVTASTARRMAVAAITGLAANEDDGIRFIEIAANLTDGMFHGEYYGKKAHPPDLDTVLRRAWDTGVQRIIITGGSLEDSRKSLELAMTDDRLFCTVGVHPTRCSEFEADGRDPQRHLDDLLELARQGMAAGKVVAIGECGLDYDRLQFCPKDVQQKYFELHFKLAEATQLPMFLHMRAAADDFLHIVQQQPPRVFSHAVVHSFTGTAEERDRILAEPRLFIGVNGCSLKTDDNLRVVNGIPPSRLMLETDCPYCEVRASHAGAAFLLPPSAPSATTSTGRSSVIGSNSQGRAVGGEGKATGKGKGGNGAKGKGGGGGGGRTGEVSARWPSKRKEAHNPTCMVKGRNEPCAIRQVLEVVCGSRGETANMAAIADIVYKNTLRVFWPQHE